MLKINQIIVPIGEQLTKEHIARRLNCRPDEIRSYTIDRESLDARQRELHYSYTVFADVKNEEKYLRLKDVQIGQAEEYKLPEPAESEERPVIVGFGPSGMFAGLILAECGARPVIIERGKPADQRIQDVNRFFKEGILDPESNVQYGEGGAGTFSDGKLTTRMNNVRVRKVMEEFIEAGADPAILYQHRPHIGTDILSVIVQNIRRKIISLGGTVRFQTRMESLLTQDGSAVGIHCDSHDFETGHVLLCTGHSASETYSELLHQNVEIVQKDFAAGVRVEHPQILINRATYRRYAGHPDLPAASYRLASRTSAGRGVYSFCMCPGGMVIPASTSEGTLAVNGMSFSRRDGKNANSAILVQIPRSDFDHGHPLDGFRFQKELEKKAFYPGFEAPFSNISDYINHTQSDSSVIETSYPRGVHMTDMHSLFSDPVNAALTEGLLQFDKRIHGFVSSGIMIGMESRSSSPIRLPRSEDGQSVSMKGLYPCGEGAGYAGGIVSSAVDGIRQAENVLKDMAHH